MELLSERSRSVGDILEDNPSRGRSRAGRVPRQRKLGAVDGDRQMAAHLGGVVQHRHAIGEHPTRDLIIDLDIAELRSGRQPQGRAPRGRRALPPASSSSRPPLSRGRERLDENLATGATDNHRHRVPVCRPNDGAGPSLRSTRSSVSSPRKITQVESPERGPRTRGAGPDRRSMSKETFCRGPVVGQDADGLFRVLQDVLDGQGEGLNGALVVLSGPQIKAERVLLYLNAPLLDPGTIASVRCSAVVRR